MTDPPDIVERLQSISVCYPECEGRCSECPADVVSDGIAAITALRQRAEAAEKHNVGLHIILRTTQRDMERAILRAADAEAAAASAIARVAELEAALLRLHDTAEPWLTTADAGLPAAGLTIGDAADLHTALRAAAAALAKGAG